MGKMNGRKIIFLVRVMLVTIVIFSLCACKKGHNNNETTKNENKIPSIEISNDYIKGVDVSSYIAQKDSGVVYKDFDGKELTDAEFFEFLAECGVNWVRIRVWNDPYDKDGNGYGGGNCDIEKAVIIGRLANDAGMKVFVDFHYSDFWADPSKQMPPKEWKNKSFDEKVVLISNYTTECLEKLVNAGVDVGMVQLGNEINSGMLGENDSSRVYQLLKSASGAVRNFSKDIKIAIHYTNPEKDGFANIPGKLINASVDFDVFAVSYYSFWHGTIENLEKTLKDIVKKWNKEILIAETSYVYTLQDGDGFANTVGNGTTGIKLAYEATVEGQANAIRDVMQAIRNVGDKGLGVFYWEPAWIPVGMCNCSQTNAPSVYETNKLIWESKGSGWATSFSKEYDENDAGKWYGGSSWDNQALFAFDGTPLESINVFKYAFDSANIEE